MVNLIASRCTEVESGGRMVDAILTQTLLPEISKSLLTRMTEGVPIAEIGITTADSNFAYSFG